MMTYTVPQSTYDTIATLQWPEDKDMSAAGGGAGLARLMFGGAEYVVGNEIKISSKANEHDIKELQASVRDARQQADWVVVSIDSHEAADPKDRFDRQPNS